MFPKFLRSHGHKVYVDPSATYLVLDFEATTHHGGPLNPDAYLILACWTVVRGDSTESKHRWGDQFEMQELLDDIASVDFVVAQNAKYELQWLKRCGLELRDVLVYCTFLGAWVLDGNQRKPKSLNALAERYGFKKKDDLVKKFWDAGVQTDDIPRDILLRYCQHDVALLHNVFKRQLPEVADLKLLHLCYVRNLSCAVLADIEFNGMNLDKERVDEEYAKVKKELNDLEIELDDMTGGLNLNSSKQLSEFLFDTLKFKPPVDHRGKPILTPGGKVSTRADHLTRLAGATKEQEHFLNLYKRYNKLNALLTKNLEFFKGVCDEYDGNFKAVFNQGITKTHRLSSSGLRLTFKGNDKGKSVQFQNLPREYKRLFWSGDEDYLIGEGDGAQLEFRVAADLGGDKVAKREIENGEDIHGITAATLTAAGEPTERQEAKSRTFRPLYGGSSGTPAEVEYCKFFNEKYEGISNTQRGWAIQVVNTKQLRTPYGMIFYWPDTKVDKRSGYINNTTSIYNFPVQGFATAEIIPIALVFFWHMIRDKDIVLVNTVHDSIIAKVHKDTVEWYEEAVRKSLTDYVFKFLKEVYDYEFLVPLGAGVKVSRNWGDTKIETKYNVYIDGTIKKE